MNGLFLTTVIQVLFLAANAASAKPVMFKNAGLKNEIIVTLDVVEKSATGSFRSREYDPEKVTPTASFTGKVVPTPKGKSGVYLEIRFAERAPYAAPPDAKKLIWRLQIVNRRAHLFIPMNERLYSFEDNIPRWAVADVELEPETDEGGG
jgi:hypothetical protein